MSNTDRAFAQGQRDARDGVEPIPRTLWERYTGPMTDAVWDAYCAGREAAR